MHSLIILCAAVFVAVVSAGTIKDEEACMRAQLKDIIDKCKSVLPEKATTGFGKCFEDEEKNGLLPKFKKCLSDAGITEASDCILFPGQGPGKAPEAGGPWLKVLPAEDIEVLKPFRNCVSEIVKEKDDCAKDCKEPDGELKKKIGKCIFEVFPKPGDTFPLTKCIHEAIAS